MASSFIYSAASSAPTFSSFECSKKPLVPSLKCLALHKIAKMKDGEILSFSSPFLFEEEEKIEGQNDLTLKQKLLAYAFREEEVYSRYNKILEIFSSFYKRDEFLDEDGKIIRPKIFSKVYFEELKEDEELFYDVFHTIKIANNLFKNDMKIFAYDFFANHGYLDLSVISGSQKRSRDIDLEVSSLRREKAMSAITSRKTFIEATKKGYLEILKQFAKLTPANFESPITKDDYDQFIEGDNESLKIHKKSFEDQHFDLTFFFPSPLHLAVLNNHIDVIEFLVRQMRFNLNYQVVYSKIEAIITPLELSIIEGRKQAFDKLIELGADVNTQFDYFERANWPDNFLKFLGSEFLDDRASICFILNGKVNPLLLACLFKDEYMILKLLRTKKVNFKNFPHYKPPQELIERGNWEEEYPAEILSNFFALIFAIKSCPSEVVQAFFENGADEDFANFMYYRPDKYRFSETLMDIPMTPLMVASDCGKKDVVDILLTNGAKINAQMPEGETVLHRLCGSENVSLDMIKHLIIKWSADVNKKDFYIDHPLDEKKHFFEETALMYLCRNIELVNVQECARWLIENKDDLGINIDDEDALNETVLMKTVKKYIEVLSDKLLKGAEQKDKLSSIKGFIEFLLVDHNADTLKRNSSGQTIFDVIDREIEKSENEISKAQLMSLKTDIEKFNERKEKDSSK